ncbi:LysR family transcriptional regulator [Neisseria animalis]|uniref:LysR family transcriptional regulator n=1 Tax=Neisseria animalis TaxID=492 RepID=A0A5P3MSP5_NEIAN|nr:LysR family transcriptional regulator [Neisseria animalis]QEY24633.1 LysR family transcriptional regulator [Neisseria animalis]ROW32956.1 LysR family transcriptional regulator [Neisseria animalis]VEE07522.1 LysR family transcriptional regulator [Neisseria animalis]
MNLKQLQYFQSIARSGSYTRAADELGVAQPVLSRQIRLLEIELRQNLLTRHGRGVTLTESGRILLEHCRIILQQIELIKEDLNHNSGKLGGHIVLGLPPTPAKLLSLPLIKRFRNELPDAQLRITEGLSNQLQDRLQQGKIDMALLYDPQYSPDIDKLLVHEERLYLVAPKSDTEIDEQGIQTAQELAELPLIMPSAPNTFRVLVEDEMARHNSQPNIILEIDSVETMLQLVAEGMGYSILSQYSIELMNYRDRIRFIPIEQPKFTSRLFLATSSKRALTRTQRAVILMLKQLRTDLVGK